MDEKRSVKKQYAVPPFSVVSCIAGEENRWSAAQDRFRNLHALVRQGGWQSDLSKFELQGASWKSQEIVPQAATYIVDRLIPAIVHGILVSLPTRPIRFRMRFPRMLLRLRNNS
jgi:hypothetical protein